jgi:Response regulator receiver domain/PilZ domain
MKNTLVMTAFSDRHGREDDGAHPPALKAVPPVRVLIVDDEACVRKALAVVMAEEGMACETAAGAEEALAILEKEPLDAVIADLRAYFEKPIDFEALRTGIANLLRAAQPERRREVRVRLRVMLKLRGTDTNEKPFEEVSTTDNVSKSGFLCGCTALLKKDSLMEVFLISGGAQFVGKARVVRSENGDTPYPRYGFCFVERAGDWVLQ